ncbi:3-dehydroquinate synthase [Candidatus Enterococcus ikei]|uniref:3-dehydroquinate synthase n=1 Tax=Candidatus Enterococcus ikei TaxID=2815326 RepID=A0ABS3H0C0_9ENTE|nr:3-dehydroquinate synthase [Enterococcus sp. DIV0869a]MBO0440958.1 3-dehydroquinate synthase [Enterococcus sp. DIV0869a]
MKLTVTLPNHSYDLTIEKGLLANIGQWAKELWLPQKIVIITDTNVQPLYGDQVKESLKEAGFDPSTFVIDAGEQSKRLSVAAEIYDFLADEGLTRSDGIIALGGGVVGDLAGFVASTYMRGLHFLQVPTTLLAQVDSSIGGKTAVNTTKAKNLVGTFAQPDGVLIDPDTLTTLEVRRVREGIAEIIKSAAIADETLWQQLDALKDEHDLLTHATEIIAACCKIKRTVVEADELDNGVRLLLNFGHTIGHALENTAGYGILTHGEGVAIGMSQITRIAEEKTLTPAGTTEQLNDMIQKFHLPITSEHWNKEELYTALTHDKKTRGGQINIILLESIGKAKIVRIPIEEMKSYLD